MSYSSYTNATQNNKNNQVLSNSSAFDGEGGYLINQTFPFYSLVNEILTHNLTNALQLKYNLRDINYKIGVVTDKDGKHLVSNFDSTSGYLTTDKLEIDATDFLNNLTPSNIITIGALEPIYSDFIATIRRYFNGDITVGGSFFNINNGVFDKGALINIANGHNFDVEGSIVSDISGVTSIKDINDKLQRAIAKNPFNNRDQTTRIRDGFQEGDVVFIPEGLTIRLSIDINPGPIYGNSGVLALDASANDLNLNNSEIERTQTKFFKTTTYDLSNITQVYTVPLSFILTNETSYAYQDYAVNWDEVGKLAGKSWNKVAVSSDGHYMTAINTVGEIYCSSNYGRIPSWSRKFSIPANDVCSINMSFNGKYQVACNGASIFVSSNYGKTNSWSKTLEIDKTIINTNVSLNGQYQAVVSSGDGLYQSSNYGITWKKYDENADVIESIKTFPNASIALSFTGRYQTIVSQYVWYSHDYGVTWRNATGIDDPYEQEDWVDVCVSSIGDVQYAAIQNGYIYKSIDYGLSWTKIIHSELSIPRNFSSISCSAKGDHITATENGGRIYHSIDAGVTWSATDVLVSSKAWKSVAVSANGQYQVACTHKANAVSGVVFTSIL